MFLLTFSKPAAQMRRKSFLSLTYPSASGRGRIIYAKVGEDKLTPAVSYLLQFTQITLLVSWEFQEVQRFWEKERKVKYFNLCCNLKHLRHSRRNSCCFLPLLPDHNANVIRYYLFLQPSECARSFKVEASLIWIIQRLERIKNNGKLLLVLTSTER